MAPSSKADTAEEFGAIREKVEQEIRDIDKQVVKLNKRKTELTELLNTKQ